MRVVLAIVCLLLLIPTASAQDTHTVASGESLMHISLHHNVCVETILDANPDLKPRSIYDLQTGDAVMIPAGMPPCYADGTTTFPYTIEAYDTLFGLAYFYGVPIMSIVEASPGAVENPNLIEVGQVLNVPISTDERIDYTYFPFNITGRWGTYLDSEALSTYTRRMGFDLQHVARWNDLPLNAYIQQGQPLYVVRQYHYRVRSENVPASFRKTVLSGWEDTWLGLALRYDVAYETLIGINGVTNPDGLGQWRVIFIPEAAADDPAPIDPSTSQYTARWGDTLHSIAQAYSTLPQLIALVNNLPDPNTIDIGDIFTIPAYIRASSGIPQIAALLILVPLTLLVTTRFTGKRKRKPKLKNV